MEYKAVIFDFNGTMLADTLFQHRAWNEVLLGRNMPELSEKRYRAELCGRSSRATVEALWGSVSDEVRYAICQEKKVSYQRICLNDPEQYHLVAGLEDYLDWLKESGKQFTIATSSSPYSVDFYFESLNLGRWFQRERILCHDRIERGKPAPDLYLAAAEELGVRPEECLVFEDANAGIRAANNAGIGKVIVIDPEHCFNPEKDLKYSEVHENFLSVERQ